MNGYEYMRSLQVLVNAEPWIRKTMLTTYNKKVGYGFVKETRLWIYTTTPKYEDMACGLFKLEWSTGDLQLDLQFIRNNIKEKEAQ